MWNWIATLDVKIQAALIASIVTLLGIFIKDYALTFFFSRRKEILKQKDIFKKYAEPLAKSLESFFWRLNEIYYIPGRAHFLKSSKSKTIFEEYKYISTLYRLASFLGWVRALRREQSFIHHSNESTHSSLTKALSNIESALADGPHVENERLKRLCELWLLEGVTKDNQIEVAVGLNTVLKRTLHLNNIDLASELNKEKKKKLCEECAIFLCKALNVPMLDHDGLHEKEDEVIRSLSIREAWLYRDWQTGIGDMMISKIDSDVRKFDVIGFRDFEQMLLSDDLSIKLWIERLERVFNNLDIEIQDMQDVRVQQLKATFQAVSKLIVMINDSGLEFSPFSTDTLELAKKHAFKKTKNYFN